MTWVLLQSESPWQRKRRHYVFHLSLCFSLPGVTVIIASSEAMMNYDNHDSFLKNAIFVGMVGLNYV